MYELTEIKHETNYAPESNVEVDLQFILNRPSKDLDMFIDFLSKESPNILPELIDRLSNRLSEFEGTSVEDVPFSYTPKNIDAYPEEFKRLRSVSLFLLKYRDYLQTGKDGKISVRYWDFISSYLIPVYLLAETLVAIGPRDKALELYKRSVDYNINLTRKLDESITCAEDYYESATSEDLATHTGTWFLTRNGVIGLKVTRCMWVEILKEFGDPELGYAVACHCDFQSAKYIGKNFRLTRTRTLMQGDEICDFCWHDVSIDKEMKHAPEEFWQELDK
ncbi:MAG: L-2-amino-thiazoline-4-carboxylic acid hydrolase [Candidatus Thorarchaeota archaeon]